MFFIMNAQVNILAVAILLIHSACGSYSGHYSYGGHGHDGLTYHGPTAIPHVLHDGHIADTHDVAVAKAEHFAAIAKAKAHSGYGHGGLYDYEGNYGYGHGYSSHGGYGHDYGYHSYPYHGPLAKPVVLKSGYLADTHDVAAAKAAHHNAVAVAKAHSGYGDHYGYGDSYGYGHSYGHNYPYHGSLAKPVVLKSGYLADTHEVAAAKAHHLSALHSTATNYGYDH